MSTFDCETEVRALRGRLPRDPVVGIIGSTEFHHAESAALCTAFGHALAQIPTLVLLTGGVEGVGETVGRAFHTALGPRRSHGRIFHILPRGAWEWDYGTTWYAGDDMEQRREILARLASLYVVIEGGPGTAHEASVALDQGALVLPLGRSGGHAAELHGGMTRPATVDEQRWSVLNASAGSFEHAAAAAAELVREHLGSHGKGTSC